VLFLDAAGVERRRTEGYLPREEFFAELHHGVARLLVVRKRWGEAARVYDDIVTKFPNTTAAAEATYWGAVSRFSQSHDHTALGAVAAQLERHYPRTVWALKASIWGQH
jgi:TolA-binding protein